MIEFLVAIKEDERGRVAFHVVTPPGMVTPNEEKVGLAFKEAITKLAQNCDYDFEVRIAKPWKYPKN